MDLYSLSWLKYCLIASDSYRLGTLNNGLIDGIQIPLIGLYNHSDILAASHITTP